MEATVVPKVGFPNRQVTKCCGERTRPGESVIVVENIVGVGSAILHKQCVATLLITMPADTQSNMTALSKPKKDRQPRGPFSPSYAENKRKPPKRKLRSVSSLDGRGPKPKAS